MLVALRNDRIMNILHPSCVSFTFSFKTVCTPSSKSNNWEMQVKCRSLKYNGLFFASLCPNTRRLFYSQRTAVPSSSFPFWGRVRLNFATREGSDQFVCKSACNWYLAIEIDLNFSLKRLIERSLMSSRITSFQTLAPWNLILKIS